MTARPGRPATAPRMPDLTGGLCRTRPDLPWHPDGNTPPALVREALQLCTRCPVMVPCGAYALKVPQDGIWGGMTQHTRDRIRHDRRANP